MNRPLVFLFWIQSCGLQHNRHYMTINWLGVQRATWCAHLSIKPYAFGVNCSPLLISGITTWHTVLLATTLLCTFCLFQANTAVSLACHCAAWRKETIGSRLFIADLWFLINNDTWLCGQQSDRAVWFAFELSQSIALFHCVLWYSGGGGGGGGHVSRIRWWTMPADLLCRCLTEMFETKMAHGVYYHQIVVLPVPIPAPPSMRAVWQKED